MKKALLVIDMQNDYLWNKRKKQFIYNTNEIVKSVNHTINEYKDTCDIIYISHLIQNIITNRLLFGYSIEGTEGAELYKELDIVSNLKFDKYFSNAYRAKKFREHMEKEKYDEIFICGLDLCGCVYHTAKGAIKYGNKVSIIEDAVASKFEKERIDKIKYELKQLGIEFI